MSSIRVLLAHDNDALRQDLAELIDAQTDMDLVGEVVEGVEVVATTLDVKPDVLLVDLSMSGCGLRALESLAEQRPDTKVVVLAMDENINLLRTVLAFGALGYVVHALSRIELVTVIRKMAHGRAYIDVPTGGLIADPVLDPKSEKHRDIQERLDTLSRREREVLEAVAYGYTNREIAEAVGVSVKSIETYRYRVAEKLGFKSRADLVRFALESGLLSVNRGDPLTAG
ncbi:MAG: response regulator transcription factor [Acidobacteriota bacterium]